MALYDEDMEIIFIIDHEILEFNKTDGWTLIGIPEKEDGNLSNHEHFCIHDGLFDRIQSTHQDNFLCGVLYQMNQMKMNLRLKQHRNTMTRSRIRRGLLKIFNQAYYSDKEAKTS